MELEHRVQALEQELQVLKNQIQVTLLEIQEQLLTHNYPTLRADQPPAPQAMPHVQPVPPAQPQNAEIPYTNQWGADLAETQVSRPRGFLPQQPPQQTLAKPEETEWTTRANLEQWVRSRIEKLGLARTRDLIREFEIRGRFSPKVCQSMLEFAEQYDAQLVNEAVKVKSARPATNSQKSSRKLKPVSTPVKPPQAKPDEAQSVVLRLIAGVANAGAGVTWRKKANG